MKFHSFEDYNTNEFPFKDFDRAIHLESLLIL